MNKVLSFKIFGMLLLPGILLVVSACSFKKDLSHTGTESQVLIPVRSESIKTLREVFEQDDESGIISSLVENQKLYLSDSEVLDLAIEGNKVQVIKFLLVKGINPFILNQSSYQKMEYDSDISGLILSGQRNVIVDLIRIYPRSNAESFLPFRDKLEKMRIGSKGCQTLVESLLDERYFGEEKSDSEVRQEIGDHLDEAVTRVLTETSCREQIKTLPTEVLRKWLSWEFMFQFQRNFESSRFIQFLAGLSKVESLNITIPNNVVYDESSGTKFRLKVSQIKLDPMALLFLKVPCIASDSDINGWISFVSKMRGDIDKDYTYSFRLPTEFRGISQCRKIGGDCLWGGDSYSNDSIVYMVSGFVLGGKFMRNAFENSWRFLVVDPNSSELQSFKKDLCFGEEP